MKDEEKIELLNKEFNRIKKMGLVKSLREGSTGIGYTFESLIGKNEDQSYEPDFNGIEIKTKLGYSKSCITLFSLTPKSIENYNMKQLLEEYGYPDKEFKYYKNFKINVDCISYNTIGNQKKYFHLNIDYIDKKIFLFIYDMDATILNDELYWKFSELENRLTTKLNLLAVITGYPYKLYNSTYYKYFKMNIYKLKDFDCFLKLLENGSIFITFNLDMFKSGIRKGQFHDHGTAFKTKKEALDKLFMKIQ